MITRTGWQSFKTHETGLFPDSMLICTSNWQESKIVRINHISLQHPNLTEVKAVGYKSRSSNEGLSHYCNCWISFCIDTWSASFNIQLSPLQKKITLFNWRTTEWRKWSQNPGITFKAKGVHKLSRYLEAVQPYIKDTELFLKHLITK